MINKFTQKAQKAIAYALSFAQDMGHSYVGTEHLLLGLITQKESIASRTLYLKGATEEKLKKAIIDYMGIGTKGSISAEEMTPRLRNIIESAASQAETARCKYVGTEHLLIALLNRHDCIAVRLLESQGISINEVKSELSAYIGSSPLYVKEEAAYAEEGKKSKKQGLMLYGKDLTAAAAQGRIDPVLCRDKETQRLIRILCRRSKNNPCLIGEPGVGKTAVVEGLAERISEGNVPEALKNKKIITLDISSMIAGAKYRGEFEDRIKSVIEEVRKNPDIILFVDEMHIMVGAGAAEGAIDASNILKPALARGELRMIGATTPTEYRTHIEKDSAFERRFQPILLSEPDEEQSREILHGLKEKYEQHHGISISDDAIDSAVRLSARYIHDRFLPDKAIDLIDEAAAKIKLCAPSNIEDSTTAKRLEEEKDEALRTKNFEAVAEIRAEQQRMSSSVTLLERTSVSYVLSADDIAAIVSEQTGIPCQNLLCSEKRKLSELEDKLSEKIIGQKNAVEAIANAIRRGRTGLSAPQRPIGSFLFLGSTGVGKTELCKVLAQTLFDSKNALIKFDMSEYMEKQSVSKLIGSPPGYVGYGEGGTLTQAVRRRPYCVILFDEIEKAHPDIFNLLLQILEDGTLNDSTGRSADFSNTVIIMTSNLLTCEDLLPRTLGFVSNYSAEQNLRENKKLTQYFKPELINRIDEIILFSKLSKDDLTKIAKIMLDELTQRASSIGVSIKADESVANFITEKCISQNSQSGARGLRREILEQIENPLSEYIVRASPSQMTQITLSVNNGNISWQYQ